MGQPARHLTWLMHWGLSVTEEREGDLEGAAEQMRLCVGVLEEIRGALGGGAVARKNFLYRRIGVYETMAELLGKLIHGKRDDLAPPPRQSWGPPRSPSFSAWTAR